MGAVILHKWEKYLQQFHRSNIHIKRDLCAFTQSIDLNPWHTHRISFDLMLITVLCSSTHPKDHTLSPVSVKGFEAKLAKPFSDTSLKSPVHSNFKDVVLLFSFLNVFIYSAAVIAVYTNRMTFFLILSPVRNKKNYSPQLTFIYGLATSCLAFTVERKSY